MMPVSSGMRFDAENSRCIPAERMTPDELRRCTARMAATSYLHWACPEYLAPQLGLAFECKSPAVNNEKFCERCAAAFLSAQMPNTGRVKKPWTHQ